MPARPRRGVVSAAALVAAAVSATACLPDAGPFVPPPVGEPIADVRVIGDSLIYRIEYDPDPERADLRSLLTDELHQRGFAVDVVAETGAETADLDYLDTSAYPADITVVALGSNDMIDTVEVPIAPGALEDATDNLRDFLDAAASECVVGVGIAETEPWNLDVTGPLWNAVVEQEMVDRGGVFVDWAAITEAHPEYLDPVDQLHHTVESGAPAYRAAVVAGIEQCAAQLAG